jgi:hypothetical protein
MNKITFEDVAHMYLGCKIQTAEGIGTFNDLAVGDDKCTEPITSYDLVHAHLNFDEVKPVLRRMDDADSMSALLNAKYMRLYMSVNTKGMRQAVGIMALCREGFDIFGLIDNGEAIDAATLGEEVQP